MCNFFLFQQMFFFKAIQNSFLLFSTYGRKTGILNPRTLNHPLNVYNIITRICFCPIWKLTFWQCKSYIASSQLTHICKRAVIYNRSNTLKSCLFIKKYLKENNRTTYKLDLTTTSEKRPPVYNDHNSEAPLRRFLT
jgi:hypothetical protein